MNERVSYSRNLSRWIFLRAGSAILMGIFATLSALAQQDRGTILGTVLDSSGAAIPNATVVVQNQGTGARRELSADASGIFVAPELPVGTYRVTASFVGFKTTVQEDINVRVSDRVKVDLKLDLGDMKETVTVTGKSPLIETVSNTLGGTITQE
jgi:hypothetical protein